MKKTTPLQAIRDYCKWCMNGSAYEVKKCPSKECPLYFLRTGYREKKISTLQAIRERCLDCMGESPNRVRKCPFKDCPLYPYRLGHNPARKGIGQSKEFMQKILHSAREKK